MILTSLSQNVYLLGTSLARPVIARGMIEVAAKEGCEYVIAYYLVSFSVMNPSPLVLCPMGAPAKATIKFDSNSRSMG